MIRKTSPTSFGRGVSVGSKKLTSMLAIKDTTMNIDGKSIFTGFMMLPFFNFHIFFSIALQKCKP